MEFEPLINKRISMKEWASWRSRVLEFAVNNGYPFAQIRLVSVKKVQEEFLSDVELDLGKLFAYEPLEFKSQINLSNRFLEGYLGVKSGGRYAHKDVVGIEDKLQRLQFVEIVGPPEVIYAHSGQATIILDLRIKKNSSANGLVGIAQPEISGDPPLITGELDVNLRNLLGSGIRFDFHFERFEVQSQSLNLSTSIPYLLGYPYEISGEFELNRFDSALFTVEAQVGLSYLFSSSRKLTGYYETEQINTQNIDTEPVGQLTVNSYGLSTYLNFQNRIYNPTRGLLLFYTFIRWW